MKLIYLEIEEEITSAIDKLQKANSTEVSLVLPKGANLLQSIVNLKLLRKHAAIQGKNVTIVTADPVGVNLAKRAGLIAKRRIDHSDDEIPQESVGEEIPKQKKVRIKSYQEIEKKGAGIKRPTSSSQKKDLPKGKPGSVNLVSHKKITVWLSVVASILIAVALFVYFYLPKATIGITLDTEEVTNDVEMVVAVNPSEVESGQNVVAGEFYEVEMEDTIERESTGEKDVGRKAQGTVTIYNNYQTSPREIPPTRFQAANGLVYQSLETVTLPGYSDTGETQVPGTVTVAVEAEEPGENYNIAPTTFAMPSLGAGLSREIYAESSSSMVGGSTEMAKVVSSADLEKAQEDLQKQLLEKAVSDFSNGDKAIISEGSLVEIISKESIPAQDEKADKFRFKMKVKIKFLSFSVSETKELATESLERLLPKDKFLAGEKQDNVTFDLVEKDIEAGRMKIFFHESLYFARSLPTELIIDESKGLSVGEVKDYFSAKDAVSEVSVDFWPFWVKKVPNREERIIVDISVK